jgi:hypothetical protein
MVVEGSETPGGTGGDPPAGGWEGRARRGDPDLLAERRARRAAESAEHPLTRRAEAAEATVRTLEAHVASLQQSLREAERERLELSSHAHAPDPAHRGHEHPGAPPPAGEVAIEQELRRAHQREYAEQRQRLEAEERLAGAERDAAAELERLRRRLSDSESEAGMLAGRLEQLRRELAEAEQALASERVTLRRAEADLQARVHELERDVTAGEQVLASERLARERAERSLQATLDGHVRLQALVAELKASADRLRAAHAAGPAASQSPDVRRHEPPSASPPARGAEVQAARPASKPTPEQWPAPAGERAPARRESANGEEMVEALAAAVERLRARAAEAPGEGAAAGVSPPRHKHSMSLIGRLRLARKQRRQR